MLTKNRIFMAIGAGTSLTITITLPIVLTRNKTGQYLFGKITSDIYKKFSEKPSFACSLNGNENCDVKFIDSSKIVLFSDIDNIEFSEFVAWSALKKGDYVLIDLKKECAIKENNETIKSGTNSFTVDFQTINDISVKTQKELIKQIQASKRLKNINNTSTKHVNSHYAIVSFSNFVIYSKNQKIILKTIEEQKMANGNQNTTDQSNPYRWQNQKKGVLYYEFAEIYDIKDLDPLNNKNIKKWDQENNLIKSLDYFDNKKDKKWLKIVFSDTSKDPDLELFDLRYDGDLVFEGTINDGDCFKRTASSTSLVACEKK